MWSDEARAAAIEARRRGAHSKTHQGKNGNRQIARKAKDDHKKSVAGGVAKGAVIGSAVGAAVGGLALRQFGGTSIGAKLGGIAGAKTGAVIGGIHAYATRKKKQK